MQAVHARVEMVERDREDPQQPLLQRVQSLMTKSLALTFLPKKLNAFAVSVHAITGYSEVGELVTLFDQHIYYLPEPKDINTVDMFRSLLRLHIMDPDVHPDCATATTIRKKRSYLNVVKKCTVLPASLWSYLKEREKRAVAESGVKRPMEEIPSLRTAPMGIDPAEGPDPAARTMELIMYEYIEGRRLRQTEIRIASTVYETPTAGNASPVKGEESVARADEDTAGKKTDEDSGVQDAQAAGKKTGEYASGETENRYTGGKETDKRTSSREAGDGASGNNTDKSDCNDETDNSASGSETEKLTGGKETDERARGKKTDKSGSGKETDERASGEETDETVALSRAEIEDKFKYAFLLHEPNEVTAMYVCSVLTFLPLLPDVRMYAFKTPEFVDLWDGQGQVLRYLNLDG